MIDKLLGNQHPPAPPVNGPGYSEITLWSMGAGKTVRHEMGIAPGSHAVG